MVDLQNGYFINLLLDLILLQESKPSRGFLNNYTLRSLSNSLVFLVFYIDNQTTKLYGVFLPLVGIIFALSTSLEAQY